MVRGRPILTSGVQRVGFAIPGPLDTVSGGYAYDRTLIQEAEKQGVGLTPLELPPGFPFPGGFMPEDPAPWARTEEILGDWEGGLLIDGLAYGAFPEMLARRFGSRTVALVHHPLALETGLSEARKTHLFATERAALAHAVGVVTTSATTARTLVDEYAVAPERITVASPGFARRPRAPLEGDPPTILAVGALIRRKCFPELIEALFELRDLPWRFRLIGPTHVDPLERAQLEQLLDDLRRLAGDGFVERIEITGAVDASVLDAAYLDADLFVSAAAHEGYGMAIAEAALHGVPIVAVASGAARETAAAGRLIEPVWEGVRGADEYFARTALVRGLAQAISPFLRDRVGRLAASERVWSARDAILTPEQTASRVLSALRKAFSGAE